MSETTTSWVISILQAAIAIGLVNVWVIRFSRATKYRGGAAQNMKEEFLTYGLPGWFVYVIGFFKLSIAFVMALVLFNPQLSGTLGVAALGLLTVLMLGAISMHIKVRDPLVKMVPAITMFSMAVLALYFGYSI